MKFQKKKKTEERIGRKLRKQARKTKQQPFKRNLEPSLEKALRKLAEKITRERKYGPELINKRFKCGKCEKVYCYTFDDNILHCEDCHARKWCSKEIRGIKTCNCG